MSSKSGKGRLDIGTKRGRNYVLRNKHVPVDKARAVNEPDGFNCMANRTLDYQHEKPCPSSSTLLQSKYWAISDCHSIGAALYMSPLDRCGPLHVELTQPMSYHAKGQVL
eukprot:scaffold137468_cov33-Prasinocladus_malaysianus.AAC.1